MKIISQAKIKYRLLVESDEPIITTALSNKVIVTLINEIISILKCQDDSNITIIIYNNSGTKLLNVTVKVYLACDEIFKTGSLIINGKEQPLLNLTERIDLGNLVNEQIIKITYQIKSSNKPAKHCLLSYQFLFNNQYQTIYLINNQKVIQLT